MNALLTCDGGVTGSVRNWLRVEGLAAFTLSVLLYWHSGTSWWMFLGLLLMADALAQTPALQMNAIYECRVLRRDERQRHWLIERIQQAIQGLILTIVPSVRGLIETDSSSSALESSSQISLAFCK
jgi:hypothetical protein